MVMNHYEVDPKYIVDKYQIPVMTRKDRKEQLVKPFFD